MNKAMNTKRKDICDANSLGYCDHQIICGCDGCRFHWTVVETEMTDDRDIIDNSCMNTKRKDVCDANSLGYCDDQIMFGCDGCRYHRTVEVNETPDDREIEEAAMEMYPDSAEQRDAFINGAKKFRGMMP